MNEDKKQPVEVADESLDQANGGLNFTMPTDQIPTDQKARPTNTYTGTTTITGGTLSAHGSGGGAGKVSMQDFH